MKKFLSLILSVLVITLSTPMVCFAAVGYYFNDGDLTYRVLTDDDESKTVSVKAKDTSISGDIVIPSTVENNGTAHTVTEIDDSGFEFCRELKNITIPDSVDSIGVLAFAGCTSLKSVTIPDSVTFIDTSAFNACTSLPAIDVDSGNDNYQSIDGVVFSKDGTTLILCPEGKSGEYTITDGVTKIDEYAFVTCKKLTSVTIPDSVTSIGKGAFFSCTGLTSITIPESVTLIDRSAFDGCTSLTSFTIPKSVTSIGDYAFYGCTSLTSVTIPNSVTEIGASAFYCCVDLTSVTFEDTLENPSQLTSIGAYAFYNCTSLNSITIPASVTTIERWAFWGCSGLTSVTFEDTAEKPSQLTTIKGNAFYGCASLTKIKIPCKFGESIFKENSSGIIPQEDDKNKYTVFGTDTSGDFEYVHNYGTGTVTTPATYLADGVKTYTCQICGETKTEAIPKLTHDDPTAGVQYWGTREVHNGHEMYVDAEGKTSAPVTGNEQIWLREESYDPAAEKNLAAWYMLDNTSGNFEAGSKFWVQWLNNRDNPVEFLTHYKNIDQTTRDRIDSNRVWIFSVGVTKPDGTTEYKTLSQEIPLYIQMGTDWDYNDIKAMYISDSEDEEVYASYLNMEYPEGKGKFAQLSLTHFSPYAIYDYLTDEEKADFDKLTDEQKEELDAAAKELISQQQEKSTASEEAKTESSSSSSAVKTGDEAGYIVLMSSALFIIAGLYLGLCMKKKRN